MYSLSDKAIDNAIKAAVEEKSRYAAERIARTESARAWYQGFIAETMDNPDIVAYRWVESNRHPTEDICDFYAKKIYSGWGLEYSLRTKRLNCQLIRIACAIMKRCMQVS